MAATSKVAFRASLPAAVKRQSESLLGSSIAIGHWPLVTGQVDLPLKKPRPGLHPWSLWPSRGREGRGVSSFSRVNFD